MPGFWKFFEYSGNLFCGQINEQKRWFSWRRIQNFLEIFIHKTPQNLNEGYVGRTSTAFFLQKRPKQFAENRQNCQYTKFILKFSTITEKICQETGNEKLPKCSEKFELSVGYSSVGLQIVGILKYLLSVLINHGNISFSAKQRSFRP